MLQCGLVLLAAGASSRLGQAKQSLKYHGKSLLEHSMLCALRSEAWPVTVVLGANAEQFQLGIDSQLVHVSKNCDWEKGIAYSVRHGLSALLQLEPAIPNAIFMVCDQPFISAAVLNRLIRRRVETGKDIVACSYRDTLGTPVLFSKRFFFDLLRLDGNEGATKIIDKNPECVDFVSFPMGYVDIDTMEDYKSLIVL